jgi:hypothetical protein
VTTSPDEIASSSSPFSAFSLMLDFLTSLPSDFLEGFHEDFGFISSSAPTSLEVVSVSELDDLSASFPD